MSEFEELTRVQTRVWVAGFHGWHGAPKTYMYLRTIHHHTFELVVELQVTHGEREIEINRLAAELRSWFEPRVAQHAQDPGQFAEEAFTYMSCEQMARAVAQYLLVRYGTDREVKVKVLEDGIHGGSFERRRLPYE